MGTSHASLQQPRYLSGVGISLALHLLLVVLWQASRPALPPHAAPPEMQFVRVLPPPAVLLPAPTPAPVRPSPMPARAQATTPAQAQAQAVASTPEAPMASSTPEAEPVAPSAAPAPSSGDLLARARAAAGAIDGALRKENPRRGIQAPIVTATMKLERGIARAAELAPNKWYQAPKTEEILDPGGYGRRRYRVTTAMGTYCVTYESNHAPDGRDAMRNGIPPKMTNCDDDEQPATIQKWN